MNLKEAIEFCEKHECYECPAIEKRTEYEKKVLQIPCQMNLIDRDEWNRYLVGETE